ncbi:MAG: LysE family translocator [Limnohabitans sp.]|jgi:threonine/homoserine/homoserine lactone efflux protein
MMTVDNLGLFIASGVLLNLSPGPDVLYIVSQSLRSGVKAGLAAVMGITAGCCVHMAAAAFGVGLLLATSTLAFNALKWVGAAYLVYMGVQLLWSRATDPAHEALQPPVQVEVVDLKKIFFKGFVTNLLNPKVALFFLAFVPQFIPVHAAEPTLTFILLGCLFNLNGLLVGMAWAWAAAGLAQRASRVQKSLQKLDRIAGLMFVGFGVKLALADAAVR